MNKNSRKPAPSPTLPRKRGREQDRVCGLRYFRIVESTGTRRANGPTDRKAQTRAPSNGLPMGARHSRGGHCAGRRHAGQAPPARHHRLRLRGAHGPFGAGAACRGRGQCRRSAMHGDRRRAQDQCGGRHVRQRRAGAHSRLQRLRQCQGWRSRRPSERQHPGGAGGGRAARRAGARDHRGDRARLRDFRPCQGTDGAGFGLGRRYRLRARRARDGRPADGARRASACTCDRAVRRARRDLDGGALRRHLRRQVDCQRAGGAERRAGRAAGRARHHRPARSSRKPAWHARGVLPRRRRLAHRTVQRRHHHERQRQGISMPGDRSQRRGRRHRAASQGERRHCRDQELPARHPGHAGLPPAEGRSEPHQAHVTRGGRSQLQFHRRRRADRRRIRARAVRPRSLGRSAGLCADGAARDRAGRGLEHAVRQTAFPARFRSRPATDASMLPRSSTRRARPAAGSTRRR